MGRKKFSHASTKYLNVGGDGLGHLPRKRFGNRASLRLILYTHKF